MKEFKKITDNIFLCQLNNHILSYYGIQIFILVIITGFFTNPMESSTFAQSVAGKYSMKVFLFNISVVIYFSYL